MSMDRITMIRAILVLVADYTPEPDKRALHEELIRQLDVIQRLIEGGEQMETMLAAYSTLVTDATALMDPEAMEREEFRAAVTVQLERDVSGDFYIDVSLNQLEGAQLAFVLSVARKYELKAREENGWLRLSQHLTGDDIGEHVPEPEKVEA